MKKASNLAEKAKEILTRFVLERHKGVQSRAARELGVPNTTLGQWIAGKRSPRLEELSPVFDLLGIDFCQRSDRNQTLPVDVAGSNFKTMPVYVITGMVTDLAVLKPTYTITAPPEYLSADFAVQISSASLGPIFHGKSLFGVKNEKELHANDLYLTNIPYEGLSIKRITINYGTKEVVFKSLNPDKEAYPDIHFSLENGISNLIGCIVWATMFL